MKEYKIKIDYKEESGTRSMKVLVDGKSGSLPAGLRRWIAEEYISGSFVKEELPNLLENGLIKR